MRTKFGIYVFIPLMFEFNLRVVEDFNSKDFSVIVCTGSVAW